MTPNQQPTRGWEPWPSVERGRVCVTGTPDAEDVGCIESVVLKKILGDWVAKYPIAKKGFGVRPQLGLFPFCAAGLPVSCGRLCAEPLVSPMALIEAWFVAQGKYASAAPEALALLESMLLFNPDKRASLPDTLSTLV